MPLQHIRVEGSPAAPGAVRCCLYELHPFGGKKERSEGGVLFKFLLDEAIHDLKLRTKT